VTDSSVSILLSVIPLRRIYRFIRIRVSGCKHFSFIKFGAAPVSTINSVSRKKPSAKIITVSAYKKSLRFRTAIRRFLRWLIKSRSCLSNDFDPVIFSPEACPLLSKDFPRFLVACENY